MDQENALKHVESVLSLTADRAAVLQSKLEEIFFRAQRLSNAMKNGTKNSDYMFGYDLQHFRNEVRAFGIELSAIPNMIGSLDRGAAYEEAAVTRARAVMHLTERLSRGLHAFQDMALLAQAHIREAEHKIEAWHMVQDVEQMVQKARPLPMMVNKVLIKISTPEGKGDAPSAPAA